MSSSAYFNHLPFFFFTIPKYRVWLPVLVDTYLWRMRSFGTPDIAQTCSRAGLTPVCTSCCPENLLQPASAPAALPRCLPHAGGFFPAASVSHFFPCRHLEHHCGALHLPPETFHRGPWRGNTSTNYIFYRISRGFFLFLFCFFLIIPRSTTPPVMAKVGAAVKLAADVGVHLHGSSPSPTWTLREAMVRQSGICWINTRSSHTVSKLLRQAGAPSAGWLGEESIGSPTVFTTTGEAISQDEWLVSAGEMILFCLNPLPLCSLSIPQREVTLACLLNGLLMNCLCLV